MILYRYDLLIGSSSMPESFFTVEEVEASSLFTFPATSHMSAIQCFLPLQVADS